MDMTWKPSLGIIFSREAHNTTLRGSIGTVQRISQSSPGTTSPNHTDDRLLSRTPSHEVRQASKTDDHSTAHHQRRECQNYDKSLTCDRDNYATQPFCEAERTSTERPRGEPVQCGGLDGQGLTSSSIRISNPLSSIIASKPTKIQLCMQYKIPKETLRLVGTPLGHLCKQWDFSLYRSPDGKPPIAHYCTQPESFERVTRLLEGEPLLGFDLEWKPNVNSSDPWWHNVAVLQLASQQHIGIFHFAHAVQTLVDRKLPNVTESNGITNNVSQNDIIPANMRTLLESNTVIKAGVNIGNDRTRLKNHCGIRMQASFELSHLFKVVKYSASKEYHLINKKIVAMSEQADEHLPLPLRKGAVRLSDWSTGRLNKEQISYSASDAYAGLMLYLEMDIKRQALDPVPLSPFFDELKQPIPLLGDIKSDVSINISLSGEAHKEESVRDRKHSISELDAGLLKESLLFARQWQGTEKSGRSANLTAAVLKSYYLWHHKSLPPQKICAVLRSPPLQIRTVTKYIWTAVRVGKLEHNKFRFTDEVMAEP